MLRRMRVASSMRLRPGANVRPVVMAEIGMRGAGRDHQIIVRHIAEIGVQQLLLRSTPRTSSISTVTFCCVAQDMPDRPGHVRRRQRRGRHLIEQRLEAMMVLPVDDGDVGRRAAQRLGSFQPAEAGADDDYFADVRSIASPWPRR